MYVCVCVCVCVCVGRVGALVRPWTFSKASHLSEMSTGVTLRKFVCVVCVCVCVCVGREGG